MGCGLSPELEGGLDDLLRAVAARLARWGWACSPLEAAVDA
jgi:hypothetical protein